MIKAVLDRGSLCYPQKLWKANLKKLSTLTVDNFRDNFLALHIVALKLDFNTYSAT